MSSTTRAGFLVPDVTDFADEVLYYDNNVTVYENELPSAMTVALPGSGNYSGRIRAQSVAQTTNPPAPAMPYYGWLYNGSAWIPDGPAGMRTMNQLDSPGVTSNYVSASGTEVFDAAPLPSFTSVQTYAGSILKFCFTAHLDLHFSNDMSVTGKLNIFLNPASGVQPNPTTSGVVRLSTPALIEGHSGQLTIGDSLNYCTDHFYGEMLYPCTGTGIIGAAAYMSLTQTNSGGSGVAINKPETFTYAASIGVSSLQIAVETMGTFSG